MSRSASDGLSSGHDPRRVGKRLTHKDGVLPLHWEFRMFDEKEKN